MSTLANFKSIYVMWVINKTINFFSDVHNEVESDAHSSRNSEIVSLIRGSVFFSEWNKNFVRNIFFPCLYKCNGAIYFYFSINENFICFLPTYFSCSSIDRILLCSKARGVDQLWQYILLWKSAECVYVYIKITDCVCKG